MGSVYFSKRLARDRDGVFQRAHRVRPKTFRSEDKAKAYAELKEMKGYGIEAQGKKFIITQK